MKLDKDLIEKIKNHHISFAKVHGSEDGYDFSEFTDRQCLIAAFIWEDTEEGDAFWQSLTSQL